MKMPRIKSDQPDLASGTRKNRGFVLLLPPTLATY